MRALLVALITLSAFAAVPAGSAGEPTALSTADCAPPCGPIPVILTVILDTWKNVEFDEASDFQTKGKVEFYFDIDQNGYAYDPAKEMKVQVKVSKSAPWLSTKVEPASFLVPIRPDQCADCVQPEGSEPGQAQFRYVKSITVDVHKDREPTQAELKRWIKPDGTYRVSITATSPDSMVGTPQTGTPAGLMEGYGIKDIRFKATPEMIAAAKGSPVPPSEGDEAVGGTAPGASLALIVTMFFVAAVLRRRP